MLSTESILMYTNRVRHLGITLSSMDFPTDEKEMPMASLNGLPDSYDLLISVLDSIGSNNSNFTLAFVQSHLLQEVQLVSLRAASSSQHPSDNTALVSAQPPPPRSRPKCDQCGKLGHPMVCCYNLFPTLAPPFWITPRTPSNSSPNSSSEHVSIVSNPSSSIEDYICLRTSDINPPPNRHSRIVDSDFTSHMTFDRSIFTEYKPITSQVHMGTNAKAAIVGIGSVVLNFSINQTTTAVKLTDVLHIPSFKFQLISVTKITKLVVQVSFQTNKCHLKFNGNYIGSGTVHDQLYYLDTLPPCTASSLPPCETSNFSSIQL